MVDRLIAFEGAPSRSFNDCDYGHDCGDYWKLKTEKELCPCTSTDATIATMRRNSS
jgi:hypothetical protein